ncbi:MAG: tetratricopeptide repeat protein, partial [Methanoregula sp.]|nr:tetratricopeptide repeat protein [Methanoregula sp.]
LSTLQQDSGACDAFTHCLDKDPKNAPAWYNRGVALQRLRRYDEALASYDHAITVDPSNVSALYNKGVLLEELARFEEALAAYNHVISLDPLDEKALYNKGVVLERLNRNTEALHAYNRALDIEPGDKDAIFAKGTVLENLGKPDASLEYYDQSLALDGKNVSVWMHKAVILEREGKDYEACECYARVLEIDPYMTEAKEKMHQFEPALVITRMNAVKNPSGWHSIELHLTNTGKSYAYNVAVSASGCEDVHPPRTFTVSHGEEKRMVIHILTGSDCIDVATVHLRYQDKMGKQFTSDIAVRLPEAVPDSPATPSPSPDVDG